MLVRGCTGSTSCASPTLCDEPRVGVCHLAQAEGTSAMPARQKKWSGGGFLLKKKARTRIRARSAQPQTHRPSNELLLQSTVVLCNGAHGGLHQARHDGVDDVVKSAPQNGRTKSHHAAVAVVTPDTAPTDAQQQPAAMNRRAPTMLSGSGRANHIMPSRQANDGQRHAKGRRRNIIRMVRWACEKVGNAICACRVGGRTDAGHGTQHAGTPGCGVPDLDGRHDERRWAGLGRCVSSFWGGHQRAFVVGLLPLDGLTIGCVRSAHQCRASGR